MLKTPKSLRLHIGVFGRTNVGKSSFINMISGQQVSITSEHPGTTTDVVEKSMELHPIGPVVFLDTAGIDDASTLGTLRTERTRKIFSRCDALILITDSPEWGEYEKQIALKADELRLPLLVVLNKADLLEPGASEVLKLSSNRDHIISLSAEDKQNSAGYVHTTTRKLTSLLPLHKLQTPPIIGDLTGPDAHVIFIVPIDIEAPKGRLILPQVQSIRDMLDHDGIVTVVKEHQYKNTLTRFRKKPDLIVCDSQVVDRMCEETPEDIPCTTFSTLFARVKGDLPELVRGAEVIDTLTPEDTILIAEACSHHPSEDDIGTRKIPRWIEEYLGFRPRIIHSRGRDYPENVQDIKLIIHCGACMLTRTEMLHRITEARSTHTAVTNYGVCISHLKGVLDRITSVFPEVSETQRRRSLRA
jgi:[FeFe] hydrogenase H-cluster maturation GTPase HydF